MQLTTTPDIFKECRGNLVMRLYDYEDLSDHQILNDMAWNIERATSLDCSTWLEFVLSLAKNSGVFLPYVNIIENGKKIRAYYTHFEGNNLYFVSKDKVYHFVRDEDLGFPKPAVGSESLYDVDTGYKTIKDLVSLMNTIFYYIQYRSCDIADTIGPVLEDHEAKIEKINDTGELG